MTSQKNATARLRRGLTAALAILLIASTFIIETDAVSQSSAQSRQASAKSGKREKERSDRSFEANRNYSRDVLWREPGDIERRNLFYGPGGREGAPDSSSPFTYVRESKSGTQKKIIVGDNRGREWTVKFGREARPETVATRIVWAVGYHADQDYFVRRARIVGKEKMDARDVRFERRDDGFEEAGNWSWKSNPFAGSRELEGLKVLMALLKNWDVKTDNNKIVRPKGRGQSGPRIYYVSDLGATLGQTGTFLNRLPFFWDAPAEWGFSPGKSKGNPAAFADEKFIKKVRDGEVVFHHRRARGREALDDVSVAGARWMGNLLGRLSEKQLADAFRAGGYDDQEVVLYVGAMRERIKQLQRL